MATIPGQMSGEVHFSRVLIADDEANIRQMLAAVLEAEGYQVTTAANAKDALNALEQDPPDVLLSDIRMPGMSGLELLEEVSTRAPEVVVIMMSAYGNVDTAIEAIKRGAYDYIAKPFKPIEALLVIRKAEERERLKQENQQLKSKIAEIATPSMGAMVARSEPMQSVFRTIRKISEYKTTVLLQGESGTGKELVARAIHQHSPRKDKPFVAVNCGAIPENLLESELFGHLKGAFTGASRDKNGLFEEANGGTLLLDEVGELPLALQVKLLRVLQEEEVRRLGESQPRSVDVRIIAATVRNLADEAREGRFREDLFYRLNVLPIVLPPLRERPEDIPLLVDHFIQRTNSRLGTSIEGVPSDVRKALMNYPWPGNVRELENTVEHAMVLADGDMLTADNLPAKIQQAGGDAAPDFFEGTVSIKKATRILEEKLIRRALKQTGGNRTSASKLLEISHRALLYKLKDYKINDL